MLTGKDMSVRHSHVNALLGRTWSALSCDIIFGLQMRFSVEMLGNHLVPPNVLGSMKVFCGTCTSPTEQNCDHPQHGASCWLCSDKKQQTTLMPMIFQHFTVFCIGFCVGQWSEEMSFSWMLLFLGTIDVPCFCFAVVFSHKLSTHFVQQNCKCDLMVCRWFWSHGRHNL